MEDAAQHVTQQQIADEARGDSAAGTGTVQAGGGLVGGTTENQAQGETQAQGAASSGAAQQQSNQASTEGEAEQEQGSQLERYNDLHPEDQIGRLHAALMSLARSMSNTADTSEAQALLA